MADAVDIITAIDTYMDEVYDMKLIPVEVIHGTTARHITRWESLEGEKLHKKIFDVGFSRTRVTTNLEEDMPDAGKVGVDDIYITDTDMRQLAATISHTLPAAMQVRGGDHACFDVAVEKVSQVEMDFGERRNQLLHGGATTTKATIAAKYNEDGSTYVATEADADAFLRLATGSVAAFARGELLEIVDAGDNIARTVVQVDDVWPARYYRGLAIGPGLIVTINATEKTGVGDATAHLDAVVATDYIRRHDDAAAAGLPASFQNLCPTSFGSALPYFSVSNRLTKQYQYLMGLYRDWTSGGAAVSFDIETHFGSMADEMAYVLGKARIKRRGRGLEFSDATVTVAPPELIRYAMNQAGEPYKHFQVITPSSLDAAARKKLVAVSGWDDLLIKLPNLPPIALQADTLAEKNVITMFDPSAFVWIRLAGEKGAPNRPTWLPGEHNTRWSFRRNVVTGNRTLRVDASAVAWETLFNESPQSSIYQVRGVKHE